MYDRVVILVLELIEILGWLIAAIWLVLHTLWVSDWTAGRMVSGSFDGSVPVFATAAGIAWTLL